MIRCLLADDHPAVLKAVSEYLEHEGFDVVATARRGDEALEKIETLKPAVAVVDLGMPGLSGIELARAASQTTPSTAVVIYTGSGDRAQLVEAVDVGARGFVLKEAPLVDLVRAIETVAGGGTYVDPVLAGDLANGVATKQLAALTQRERDVLRLLANGKKYEEIGKELLISPDTVRTHVQKAMKRLDASTRTQAVADALRQALIT